MRWADFGPTPGRQRSAWVSSSRAAGLSIRISERQVETGRQVEARCESGHLRLGRGFGPGDGIVESGRHQVLEHVLGFAQEARVDRDSLSPALAGHGHPY